MPVISFEFKLKLPPSCGVVSFTKSVLTVEKLKTPAPFVFKNCPVVPSACGCDNPSITTEPAPLGVIDIFPLDTDTIELPLTSKFAPNCGEASLYISLKFVTKVPKMFDSLICVIKLVTPLSLWHHCLLEQSQKLELYQK